MNEVRSKRLSYTGDVVKSPEALTWEQVSAALPLQDICGRIRATDQARGAMKTFLGDPQPWLENARALPTAPRTGNIIHDKADKLALARCLRSFGVGSFAASYTHLTLPTIDPV